MRSKLLLSVLLLSFSVHALANDHRVLLLWDSSLSMSGKQLDAELQQLATYFQSYPNAEVKLRVFSNSLVQESTFQVVDSDFAALKADLKRVIYDGTPVYEGLFEGQYDAVILVGAGMEHFDKLPTDHGTAVYVFDSVNGSNAVDLKVLAYSSGGDYLGLQAANSPQAGVNQATEEKEPIGSVRRSTVLPKRGEREKLDEVYLEERIEPEPEMVNLGAEKRDKRKLGYSTETITSEDIGPVHTDVQTAVQGQFSNLIIQSDTANDDVDLTQFLGRNRNMTLLANQYGVVIIDGVPYTSDSSTFGRGPANRGSTNHIDPSNIHSVTYLKGLAATNRYGSLGAGGVLLITTKTFALEPEKQAEKKPEKPLGTTPYYDGSAALLSELPDTPYLQALKQAGDIESAYSTYLGMRSRYGQVPSFYHDVAAYFDGWGNPDLVDRVLSNVTALDDIDQADFLALAYAYESYGRYDRAVTIYQDLIREDPTRSQYYRNLANAMAHDQQFEAALDLYNRLSRGHIAAVRNHTGLQATMEKERNNFVRMYRHRLPAHKIDASTQAPESIHRRIVLEWSHWDAHFDLQIVNPDNRFFTWEHSPQGDPTRFALERSEGYGLEEYFLTEQDRGNWLFNVNYKGGEHLSEGEPIYLKLTVQENFGKPNQTQEVKVFALSDEGMNRELVEIEIK